MVIVLLAVMGCKDEAKLEASKVEFDKERSELMARLKKKKVDKVAHVPKAAAPAGVVEPAFAPIADSGFSYDPTGLRDPFRSFEWERDKLAEAEVRGPLEEST
jgi:hypothetical protein